MNAKKVLIVVALGLLSVGCSEYSGRINTQAFGGSSYPTLVRIIGQIPSQPPIVTTPTIPTQPPQTQPPPTTIRRTATVPGTRQPTSPVVVIPAREVYISGGLRSEVKWAVIRQLRNLGYQVTTKSSKAPLRLRIRMTRRGNRKICTAVLYNRDGQVVAQGQGESTYWYFRVSGRYGRLRMERSRYNAEIEAALAAIQSMACDHY